MSQPWLECLLTTMVLEVTNSHGQCSVSCLIIKVSDPSVLVLLLKTFWHHDQSQPAQNFVQDLQLMGLPARSWSRYKQSIHCQCDQQWLDIALDLIWYLWSQQWRALPQWWLLFCFWVIPINPPSVATYNLGEGVWIISDHFFLKPAKESCSTALWIKFTYLFSQSIH